MTFPTWATLSPSSTIYLFTCQMLHCILCFNHLTLTVWQSNLPFSSAGLLCLWWRNRLLPGSVLSRCCSPAAREFDTHFLSNNFHSECKVSPRTVRSPHHTWAEQTQLYRIAWNITSIPISAFHLTRGFTWTEWHISRQSWRYLKLVITVQKSEMTFHYVAKEKRKTCLRVRITVRYNPV